MAKVLIVDDDASVQRMLQYNLQQEGYEVLIASRRDGCVAPVAAGGAVADPPRQHDRGAGRLRGRHPHPRRGVAAAGTSRSSC